MIAIDKMIEVQNNVGLTVYNFYNITNQRIMRLICMSSVYNLFDKIWDSLDYQCKIMMRNNVKMYRN